MYVILLIPPHLTGIKDLKIIKITLKFLEENTKFE